MKITIDRKPYEQTMKQLAIDIELERRNKVALIEACRRFRAAAYRNDASEAFAVLCAELDTYDKVLKV